MVQSGWSRGQAVSSSPSNGLISVRAESRQRRGGKGQPMNLAQLYNQLQLGFLMAEMGGRRWGLSTNDRYEEVACTVEAGRSAMDRSKGWRRPSKERGDG